MADSFDPTGPGSEPSPDQACAEMRAALPLFAGGDLDPEEQATVQQHLDRCPSCALQLAPWVDVRDELARERSRQDRLEVPDLWQGIRAELVREGRLRPEVTEPAHARASEASPVRPARRARAPQRVLRLVAPLVAAALVLLWAQPFQSRSAPASEPLAASTNEPMPPAAPGASEQPTGLPDQRLVDPPGLLAEALPEEAPESGRLRPLAPGDRGLAEDSVELLRHIRLSPVRPQGGNPMMLTGGH